MRSSVMRWLLVMIATATGVAACGMPGWAADATSHKGMSMPMTPDTPSFSGLGPGHHVVSTRNPEAQRWFDQGLALCYAFNHEEAIRSFERASAIDPSLAMAHWGVALALGPNINMPMDDEHEAHAVREIAAARKLVGHATPAEQAYVAALAARYGAPAPTHAAAPGVRAARDSAYSNAMDGLMQRFSADPDAAVLWAESAMDLRPWQYWSLDGTPAPGTLAFVAVLEAVVQEHPDHAGANHLLIHAVEASSHPERASQAAERLKTLAPDAGHLVHMPTHIGARLGDWVDCGMRNDSAAAVDSAYIAAHHVEGIYPMLYYNHNLQFAAFGWTTAGNYARALRPARTVVANAEPLAHGMSMLEMVTPTVMLVQTRFRKWHEIAATPKPPADLRATCACWHFAQGMRTAFAGHTDSAAVDLDSVRVIAASLPPDAMFGLNPTTRVLALAGKQLAGRLAESRGQTDEALARWREAVAAEDSLAYDEPPDWYLFSRESLGGALLRSGRPAEAILVFERELEIHPHSPRAQLALKGAYDAAGRRDDAMRIDREMQGALHSVDTPLVIRDY